MQILTVSAANMISGGVIPMPGPSLSSIISPASHYVVKPSPSVGDVTISPFIGIRWY